MSKVTDSQDLVACASIISRLALASGHSPADILRFVLRDGLVAVELSIRENAQADAEFEAGAYWRKLKRRLNAEGRQPVRFCHGLKLQAPDGKQRETDCANTEGMFRIIQSIPSPKAGPFKRWLAQVGYERVKEIENPELASARARELYQAKGYPQA